MFWLSVVATLSVCFHHLDEAVVYFARLKFASSFKDRNFTTFLFRRFKIIGCRMQLFRSGGNTRLY